MLPTPAEGPGPTFDATATRAATSKQIRNVAQPDLCFDVSDFEAGDFRFNLVPIALKKCDASVDGQKFDLITKVGNHSYDGRNGLVLTTNWIGRESIMTCKTEAGQLLSLASSLLVSTGEGISTIGLVPVSLPAVSVTTCLLPT